MKRAKGMESMITLPVFFSLYGTIIRTITLTAHV